MRLYTQYSDEELLKLMANDDSQAFTELYNHYWKMMYSVAYRKLGNAWEAEETVQDIFLDLWNRRGRLELHSSLSSYLSVSVNYRVLKVLAKKELHARYMQFKTAHTTPYQMDQLLDFEEVQARLHFLVAQLPKKCRLVFQMSREHQLSGKEIARKLGISEKTVEGHLFKALKQLKIGLGLMLISVFIFSARFF